MWIESIDLDDFGHFERARMAGLDSGLTVIAGPQRAGKTTLMEAIRYLGYGLTAGTDVPPPSDRYDVSATVVADEYRYEIALDGYADPQVTPLDPEAPDRTARELFGGMRKTQYQQLYTVTLEELRRDPDSLDGDVDLSNVLLEAASGTNITDVPDTRDEFADRAKDIGGKHGRKSYDLKGPLNTIEDGIEARDAANAQVDEHRRKSEKVAELEGEIDGIEAEVEAAERERMQLEAVVTSYDIYEEFQELDGELASKAVDGVDQFPLNRLDDAESLRDRLRQEREAFQEGERAFEAAISAPDPERYRERVLEAKPSIERFERERSGWAQQAETLQERATALDQTRRELETTAQSLVPDSDADPLEYVRAFEGDVFASDTVERAVEDYESADADVSELDAEIDERETRLDELETRIDEAVESETESTTSGLLPVAVVGSLLALLAGGALAVAVNPILGVATATIVLLAAGAYGFSRFDPGTPEADGVAVDTLRAEVEKVETALETKRSQLADRREVLDGAEAEIERIRDRYGLPESASATAIGQFQSDLVELKRRLADYDAERARHEERVAEFRGELASVGETLEDIGVLQQPVEDPIEEAETVFGAIDRAGTHLGLAEDVQQAARSLEDVEEAAEAVLDEWSMAAEDEDCLAELERFVDHGHRVQEYRQLREKRDSARETLLNHLGVQAYAEALEPLADRGPNEESTWLLAAYETVLDDHGSIDSVREYQTALEGEIDRLEGERDSRQEEKMELEQQLDDLASDEDLRAAYETIERGRGRLRPLAERYATYRISEYLLDELHERFLERTTGPLLAEASEIFERITGSAYTEIDTRSAFDDLDFEAVLEDGGVHRTGELSRATTEQLFLAVRLARIKRYEEPLPVLLDDSLTNFDPGHVQRTLEIVSELAQETQVLLLTCHPTLVDRVAEIAEPQFWRLEDGVFDGPHQTPEPIREAFDEG